MPRGPPICAYLVPTQVLVFRDRRTPVAIETLEVLEPVKLQVSAGVSETSTFRKHEAMHVPRPGDRLPLLQRQGLQRWQRMDGIVSESLLAIQSMEKSPHVDGTSYR